MQFANWLFANNWLFSTNWVIYLIWYGLVTTTWPVFPLISYSALHASTLLNMAPILGDPGASSRDDAIFLGEILLQELRSPRELIVHEPVPEVVEFCPADWAEKYFSSQSAMRSSRVTLSPSYTTKCSLAIDLVALSVQREDC